MDLSQNFILSAGLFLLVGSVTCKEAEWGYYGGHGLAPNEWSINYTLCGDNRQSPIAIDHDAAMEDAGLGPLNFTGYDVQGSCNVTNNDHTVFVVSNQTASISGGGLDMEYNFVQFHIHWGSDNGKGSEHTLNGKQYSAEIHFVHRYNDTYAVLGVFVEVGSTNHSAFQQLVDALQDATYKEDTSPGFPLSLGDILPSERAVYYRYEGSLTTPPCTEVVTWTVFRDRISVSQSQIDALRPGYDGHATDSIGMLQDNFRPVQLLNNRTVRHSVDPVPPVTMTTTTTVTTTVMVMTTACAPSPVTGVGVVLGSVLAAVWAMQWSD